MKRTLATALPLLFALAAPAVAQDAKTATKAAKANVMTREELRACMDERDAIAAERAQVQKENASLGALQGDIKRGETTIAERRATLDPADAAGATALQADIAKHDEGVEQFNSRLRALKEKNQALETRRAAYVQKCETRSYDEMDEAAIIRDRRKAAQAAAKGSAPAKK
jgi:exonuclease VII large subunit